MTTRGGAGPGGRARGGGVAERGALLEQELAWAPVSWARPCPVCGAADGCQVAAFRGGVAVDCQRVVSAWPMVGGGWLHRLPAEAAADDASEGATCAFPVPRAGRSAGDAAPRQHTVVGAFATRELAEHAVGQLIAAGFREGEVSLLGRRPGAPDEAGDHPDAAGVIGSVGAVALNLAAATIPGIGPVVALGPLAETLAAGLRGGLVGDLVGVFTAHGVPDHAAAGYTERVRAGESVVAVHTTERQRAAALLARAGAVAPVWCVPAAGGARRPARRRGEPT